MAYTDSLGRVHEREDTRDADNAARDRVGGTDWDAIERELRGRGGSMDVSSELEDIRRNYGMDVPKSLDELKQGAFAKIDQRLSSDSGGGRGDDDSPSRSVSDLEQRYAQSASRLDALVGQLSSQQAEDRERALAQQAQTKQYLDGVLSSASKPVDIADPQFAPIVKAGRLSDQRQLEQRRAALAERLASEGLGDSGAFNAKLSGIQQQIGEGGSMREANLMVGELQNRRQQMMQALALAQSSGNFQQAQALQQQLAAIDTQMNTMRLDESARQFDENLGLGYGQLGQQRYAFDNDLGFRLAALQAQLNAQPFPYLFG